MNTLIGKQLSVFDAAAVLNVGRDSVVRAIRNKKLKAWKLDTGCGRKNISWRIRGEDLIEYMDRNSNRN
jgi:excisionase family DNA binding protein